MATRSRSYHNGGDTLQSNEIEILVDGNLQTDASKKAVAAWTSWSPGESLVADIFSIPKIVRIIYKGPSGSKTTLATADFSPSGMSNPGPISTSTLQAAFSSSPSSGTPPLVVQFFDLSTGSPVGWNWAFGDGGTSSGQNPTHVFGSSGTYTVSLTVTNATGSVSSVTHPITVSTSAPPRVASARGQGTRGTSIPISVYGTGFVSGATIKLKRVRQHGYCSHFCGVRILNNPDRYTFPSLPVRQSDHGTLLLQIPIPRPGRFRTVLPLLLLPVRLYRRFFRITHSGQHR